MRIWRDWLQTCAGEHMTYWNIDTLVMFMDHLFPEDSSSSSNKTIFYVCSTAVAPIPGELLAFSLLHETPPGSSSTARGI